jgi:hypothetical protein
MTTLWDPLENVSDLSKTLVADARRREIRNILKSYVGFFDPFAEAIQNAMDAVERRERVLGEPKFQKRLWILIDLKRNSFSVTDNGCGFTESEFKTFLCPSVSFNKDGETTRGRKGVGATYLAYGFNRLQLGTKTPDYEQLAEINEGRTWVEDENGLTPRPQVSVSEEPPEAFERLDRGSTFTIKFGGKNTRPGDLGWISATTAEQWRVVLLLKTPLGYVSIRDDETKSLILFDVEVIDKEGKRTFLEEQKVGYLLPDSVIASSVQLKEILDH